MNYLRLRGAGQIVEELGIAYSTLRYYLESRDIKPIATVGGAHVYDDSAVERIRSAIAETASRKAGRKGSPAEPVTAGQ